MFFDFSTYPKVTEACSKATEGTFLALELSDCVPSPLRNEAPAILWLSPNAEISCPAASSRPVITGRTLDRSEKREICLVSVDEQGKANVHFPLTETLDEISLEKYREDLRPPFHTLIPFNYSRLPNWVKGLGKAVLGGGLLKNSSMAFPDGDPSFAIEWLKELADWCEVKIEGGRLMWDWPEGYRAAATISHDVDTDWLFTHADWIERICDMEEEHGFRGVWFCVPRYCRSRTAERGIQRLVDRGCEIGCHGYNHDAKLPFLGPRAMEKRFREIKAFSNRWQVLGFRSEWLLRTPSFVERLSEFFEYDSSVPNLSLCFTASTRNGCATCHPFRNYGGIVELPVTLPQDVDRDLEGSTLSKFWFRQVERAKRIGSRGGLVMLSIHPQGHQSAHPAALEAISSCLKEIKKIPGLWLSRPDHIVDWIKRRGQL